MTIATEFNPLEKKFDVTYRIPTGLFKYTELTAALTIGESLETKKVLDDMIPSSTNDAQVINIPITQVETAAPLVQVSTTAPVPAAAPVKDASGYVLAGLVDGNITKCPICGHDKVWDNRPKKAAGQYKPTAPDFKCGDKECGGAAYVDKENASLSKWRVLA